MLTFRVLTLCQSESKKELTLENSALESFTVAKWTFRNERSHDTNSAMLESTFKTKRLHPVKLEFSSVCFNVPVRSLLSSNVDFVPCDRLLQRAHYLINSVDKPNIIFDDR